MKDNLDRCPWAGNDPLYIKYHDEEWGVPVYNDRKMFEFLVLESAQAGLSWITILKRRENYRKAFENFDPIKVAGYDEKKINELLNDSGIIRNRKKIEAAVNNAKMFLKVKKEFGTFYEYLWRFTGGKTKHNSWKEVSEIPPITAESENMSRDLIKRGFRFVGPTICYAHMQAVGMVNDHIISCFRYRELLESEKA